MRRFALAWLAALAACALPARPAAVGFELAAVWIRHGADSTRLAVEVASTPAQHEVGLSERESLAADSGMLFVFDSPRYAGDGFWMWRTRIPLDVAFVDSAGVILRIMGMDPCGAPRQEECPGYYPGVEYSFALEVGRGWFAARGIGPGAVVRVER
jgi:uncharacterized membrane protein (UPF0127 family)